jgi:hypothetical protein
MKRKPVGELFIEASFISESELRESSKEGGNMA